MRDNFTHSNFVILKKKQNVNMLNTNWYRYPILKLLGITAPFLITTIPSLVRIKSADISDRSYLHYYTSLQCGNFLSTNVTNETSFSYTYQNLTIAQIVIHFFNALIKSLPLYKSFLLWCLFWLWFLYRSFISLAFSKSFWQYGLIKHCFY
jgi:hypothetical protein